MTPVGIFYGSTDGATARIAQLMKEKLEQLLAGEREPDVELFDIAQSGLAPFARFEWLILGVPTWNTGQLQRDWERVLPELAGIDLPGKRVAIFGLGDQVGYPATFVDAMFFVADYVRTAGAALLGAWPIDGYEFVNSWAVEDGQFLGLVLDEHSQADLTAAG
ncbi:MAG: flavodoxin [Anaerolineales bacterium]|nr:flavodoxin [Anaerolineales bacterium]